MRALALVLVVLLASGCALWSRDAAKTLADAEARTAQGDYPAALAAYDAYLSRFPEDDGVGRARAVRALMGDLLAARAEVAALRDRVGARAASDAAELARLRQELSNRQAEVARLREDLEALKRTDLQMERKRR